MAEGVLHTEEEFILDKSFKCPVCYSAFRSKVMKTGKARMANQDMDLRPRFEYVDPMKYDVILCPRCGYAALGRYFETIGALQIKMVRESICAKYQPKEIEETSTYSYEQAKMRFKLALANNIAKSAKPSENAYLLLRYAWLIRGQYEALDPAMHGYTEAVVKLQEEEDKNLKGALDGFLKARETERFPIVGMDETTLDYLIAILATRFGDYDLSSQLVGRLLTTRGISSRMKDHLLELKETIQRTKK